MLSRKLQRGRVRKNSHGIRVTVMMLLYHQNRVSVMMLLLLSRRLRRGRITNNSHGIRVTVIMLLLVARKLQIKE